MERETLQKFDRAQCPVFKSVEEIGDRWVLLILRECFLGYKRFEEFHQNLRVSKSVLTVKLNHLVSKGILKKHPYKTEKGRTLREYRLTRKGFDLIKLVYAMLEWGNKYLIEDGHNTLGMVHRETREKLKIGLFSNTGQPAGWSDIDLKIQGR